jgi:hypothetical protein
MQIVAFHGQRCMVCAHDWRVLFWAAMRRERTEMRKV